MYVNWGKTSQIQSHPHWTSSIVFIIEQGLRYIIKVQIKRRNGPEKTLILKSRLKLTDDRKLTMIPPFPYQNSRPTVSEREVNILFSLIKFATEERKEMGTGSSDGLPSFLLWSDRIVWYLLSPLNYPLFCYTFTVSEVDQLVSQWPVSLPSWQVPGEEKTTYTGLSKVFLLSRTQFYITQV